MSFGTIDLLLRQVDLHGGLKCVSLNKRGGVYHAYAEYEDDTATRGFKAEHPDAVNALLLVVQPRNLKPVQIQRDNLGRLEDAMEEAALARGGEQA